ncbi:MAG: hypothetical protein KJ624_02005 [Chloroflexi bacterium]|nr:hypothetical protein [Chloroflexota bacterium]
MSRRLMRALLGFLLVLPLVAAIGCATPPSQRAPLLPQGFDVALLPNVDIQGYIYVNQQAQLSISATLSPGFPAGVGVNSASGWFGPSVEAFGAALDMRRETEAQLLSGLRTLGALPLWALASGRRVFLAAGSGVWTENLKAALFTQRMSPLATKYPAIWGDFAYFPGSPPARPVGGGFLRIDGELVGSLGPALGFPVATLTQPLLAAGISYAPFLLYADGPIELPERIDGDLFKRVGLRALVVGHSGYPPLLFTLGFNSFVQQAGLSRTTVRGMDIYTYPAPAPGIEMLLGRKENLLYISIAPTREMAEGLLLSALE